MPANSRWDLIQSLKGYTFIDIPRFFILYYICRLLITITSSFNKFPTFIEEESSLLYLNTKSCQVFTSKFCSNESTGQIQQLITGLLFVVYIPLNTFRVSLFPLSGAYQLQQQPLVYRPNVVVAVLLFVVRPVTTGPTTTNSTATTKFLR
jgi:hypothetical protein